MSLILEACLRKKCGYLPAPDSGEEHGQLSVTRLKDGTFKIVNIGNICKKCFLVWDKVYRHKGSWPEIAGACNEDSDFDDEFEFNYRKLMSLDPIAHTQAGIFKVQTQLFDAYIKLKGLTGPEFLVVFKHDPADLGFKLELLRHPTGKFFWGVLLLNSKKLKYHGVTFKFSMSVATSKEDMILDRKDHVLDRTAREIYMDQLTPSKDEDLEVSTRGSPGASFFLSLFISRLCSFFHACFLSFVLSSLPPCTPPSRSVRCSTSWAPAPLCHASPRPR